MEDDDNVDGDETVEKLAGWNVKTWRHRREVLPQIES